jgi:hypothetical protein
MLTNHLNQDALDGYFAPSVPSSITPAGKKKKRRWNVQTTTSMLQPWVCSSWLRAWRSYHRPLVTTMWVSFVSWSPLQKTVFSHTISTGSCSLQRCSVYRAVRPESLNMIHLTAAVRVRSRVSPRGIWVGRSGNGTRFSQSTAVFPCNSINAPYSSLSRCRSVLNDKRAKPGNLPKSNALFVIRGHRIKSAHRRGSGRYDRQSLSPGVEPHMRTTIRYC